MVSLLLCGDEWFVLKSGKTSFLKVHGNFLGLVVFFGNDLKCPCGKDPCRDGELHSDLGLVLVADGNCSCLFVCSFVRKTEVSLKVLVPEISPLENSGHFGDVLGEWTTRRYL